MNKAFPMVPLGEVLTKSEEWITLEPDKRYREVTVRLWGKGVVQRRDVIGAEIAARRRLVVRSQQFIMSRIDARNGAFGLVPDSLDGAIVSNDFPVFTPNRSRILPTFLSWMSKTHGFVGLCKAASEGTTNRVRLVEDRFLATQIPLPPLSEQRRIVPRIEELAAKIEEAWDLRHRAVVETEGLTYALLHSLIESQSDLVGSLGQGIVSVRNGLSRRPSGTESGPIVLRLADVANGVVDLRHPRRGNLSELEFETYRLSRGDLLFVRVNGSPDIVGRCVTFHGAGEAVCFNDHLIRVRLNPEVFDWRYVAIMANGPMAREYIGRTAITTAGQMTINHGMLAALPIPVPPISLQRRIVAYIDDLQAKLDALKRLQAETAAELDAMLPSILDKAFKGGL